MIKEREVSLVLQAKTINHRYCAAECAFSISYKDTAGEVCYACSLFGGLKTEFEGIDLLEEDDSEEIDLTWVELPVRSENCCSMMKEESE